MSTEQPTDADAGSADDGSADPSSADAGPPAAESPPAAEGSVAGQPEDVGARAEPLTAAVAGLDEGGGGQQSAVETADGETADGETADGETADGETADGDAGAGEAAPPDSPSDRTVHAGEAEQAREQAEPRPRLSRRLAGAAMIVALLAGSLALWAFLLTGGAWPPFRGTAASTATTIQGRAASAGASSATTTSTTPTPATHGPNLAARGSMTGRKAPTCVNGWETPDPDEAVWHDGLGIIKVRMGVTGTFQVVELRYFVGIDGMEWWYVKAFLAEDLDFQGRWLVERRSDGIGRIVAVAPYESEGLRSPDWYWFDGQGSPVRYPSLPGTWAGTPYDFVAGSTGLTGGLPSDVRGCVAGT